MLVVFGNGNGIKSVIDVHVTLCILRSQLMTKEFLYDVWFLSEKEESSRKSYSVKHNAVQI